MTAILPIVEGDDDIVAVPILVRRVAQAICRFDVQVLRPHKRGDLDKVRSRFEDFLKAAVLESAPILWVLDYDCETCDDVNRDLAALAGRAQLVVPGHPVEFAFLVKEFESLFLADFETLRSVFSDIPAQVAAPTDPEGIRGAKEWISKARPKGASYKPSTDQGRITAQIDLVRLRQRSASFVRFELALKRLMDSADADAASRRSH